MDPPITIAMIWPGVLKVHLCAILVLGGGLAGQSSEIYIFIHGQSVEMDQEYYEDPRYYDTLHRANFCGDSLFACPAICQPY
jgi:hypothetical protein